MIASPRFIDHALRHGGRRSRRRLPFRLLYWLVFPSFLALMFVFVSPTFDKSYTLLAGLLCILLVLTPTDHRAAVLIFLAGSGLGWFLERWGTTRECWTYYTYQTPPLFAVLAHGMASVAFWRAGRLLKGLARCGASLRLSLRNKMIQGDEDAG